MADEYKKSERLETIGFLCTMAATGALIWGLCRGIDYYEEKREANEKPGISLHEHVRKLNSDLEKSIAACEKGKNDSEKQAKDNLRQLLADAGVTDEADVDYFHNVMKDKRGRTVFREYMNKCLDNNKKFTKDGFKSYVTSKINALNSENEQLEKEAKEFMRNSLSELGITDEEDVEYFHNVMKDPKNRKELKNYIDDCILRQNDFSAEGFKRYLARNDL
ncbi:MAG: hypothetical protein QXM31_04655 [Candidatus Woesearchaeota archaeon]